MRVTARETAFKIIFASQFTGEIDDDLARNAYKAEELTADDIAYADKVLQVVKEHGDEFAAALDKVSRAFPEARIFPADKSVLYVAMAEIGYFDDIPKVVSVNEAANIAAKYSSEKSASFVSGLLAGMIKE